MILQLNPQLVQSLINYLDTKPHQEVRFFIDSLTNAAQESQQLPPEMPPTPPQPPTEKKSA